VAWQGKAGHGKARQGMARLKYMFQPKGEKALWRFIYDYVSPLSLDDVVSYDDLSEVVDQDIKKNRSVIYTANKHLLKDFKRLLVVERGIGYRVVDGMDIMNHAEGRQKMAKRAVSMADYETANINTVKLTPDERDRLQKFMNFNANIRAAFAQKIDRIEKANQVSQIAQQFTANEIEGLKKLLNTK